MDVKYTIIRDGKTADSTKYKCFSKLSQYRDCAPGTVAVDYELTYNNNFTPEEYIKFNDLANSFGLIAEHKVINNVNHFIVTKQGKNYLSLLAPLVMYRYLEEDSYPTLVRNWFNLMEKYKETLEFSPFYLLQYAHYITHYSCTNHAFLEPLSYPYKQSETCVRNFINLDEFKDRLLNFSVPHQTWGTVGLSQLFLRKDNPFSAYKSVKENIELFTDEKTQAQVIKSLIVH